MPYIDSYNDGQFKFREGTFLEDFVDLFVSNGWTKERDFYKIAYSSDSYRSSFAEGIEHVSSEYAVAKHVILSNSEGKYLGFSLMGSDSFRIPKDESSSLRRKEDQTDVEDPSYEEDLIPFDDFAITLYKDNEQRRSFYVYTLENLPSEAYYKNDGTVHHVVVDSGMSGTTSNRGNLSYEENAALDLEVYATTNKGREWSFGGVPDSRISEWDHDVMQSPIMRIDFRPDFIEDVETPVKYTNWWDDSEIRVVGQINDKTAFLTIQSDVAPDWKSNVIPTVPLYFGKIHPIEGSDFETYALFAGTLPSGNSHDSVSTYDFDDYSDKVGESVMPLLKDYPSYPSNGVDTVMVMKSKYGARYQDHYLSWGTNPNEMPPEREFKGKQYDRAYNPVENTSNYKYPFNPSRYTGKLHSTRIYVIHPEEGVRGYLDASIGLNPQSVSTSKFNVKVSTCPDVYEKYNYLPVSAVSPLTKRPGTPYRPVGLGVSAE